MTTAIDTETYIAALTVDEIFADPTYQRTLDVIRARKMYSEWDPRLAGIVEVSDRGKDASPRYAVVDGMHRWAAAGYFVNPPPMVANVHTGLSVADEAELFDKLNRQRKQTNTFDHWKARRAAGDVDVLAIESITRRNGLDVHMSPSDDTISCVAALEKIVKLGGIDLLGETISLIVEIWHGRRESLESPVVHGLALVLHYLADPIDLVRLGDTLLEVQPRQLRSQAAALKDISAGSGAVLTAIAMVSLYNKRPGRRILVSNKTFSGKRRDAAIA